MFPNMTVAPLTRVALVEEIQYNRYVTDDKSDQYVIIFGYAIVVNHLAPCLIVDN